MRRPVFDAGQPVNLGRVWFAGQTPPGTILRVQFRTSADGEAWPEWHRVPGVGLWQKVGEGRGPDRAGRRRGLCQYRARHGKPRDPSAHSRGWCRWRSPLGEQLFAEEVTGAIAPQQRPVLGEETVFTYTLDVEIGPEDLGFDQVHIGLPGAVQQVRFDGLALPEDGYEAGWDDEGIRLALGAEHRVSRSGRLEVEFASVLLRPTLAVRTAMLALGDSARTGRTCGPWQKMLGPWWEKGVVGRALPRTGVSVRPNPFRRGLRSSPNPD